MNSTLNPANFYGTPASASSAPWRWDFFDAEVESPVFTSRLDAQAWLGENLDELRTATVTAAQLTHLDQAVGIIINFDQKPAFGEHFSR